MELVNKIDNGINMFEFLNKIEFVIVLDGELPEADVFHLLSNAHILAADAAAWRLHDYGLHPHTLLGDMDSLHQVARARGFDAKDTFKQSQWIEESDQDTTDFEKALNYAIAQKWPSVLILGLFGKEIDHSLYNLSHLLNYAPRIELLGLHLLPEQKMQWVMPLTGSLTLSLPVGSTLSVLPMPELTVSAPHLMWPLNEITLTLTHFNVRNQTITEKTSFTPHQGQGLLVINSQEMPEREQIH